MRRARVAALVLALLALGAGTIPEGVDEAEYLEATKTVLCDCGCHPQSVYDCACGRADEMRAEIAAKIRGGMSGAEVVAGYVALHGEKILVAPPGRGFNLLAWLGPLAGLIAAGSGLALVLRRWRRGSGTLDARAAPAEGPSGEELARLERELREFE